MNKNKILQRFEFYQLKNYNRSQNLLTDILELKKYFLFPSLLIYSIILEYPKSLNNLSLYVYRTFAINKYYKYLFFYV